MKYYDKISGTNTKKSPYIHLHLYIEVVFYSSNFSVSDFQRTESVLANYSNPA